jgi:hypothetical protein
VPAENAISATHAVVPPGTSVPLVVTVAARSALMLLVVPTFPMAVFGAGY